MGFFCSETEQSYSWPHAIQTKFSSASSEKGRKKLQAILNSILLRQFHVELGFPALRKMATLGLLQQNSLLQCKQPGYLDVLTVLIPFTRYSEFLFKYIKTSR